MIHLLHCCVFLSHSSGSSTICVVALHRDEKMLYSANLGDSGFLVIRSGEVIHRSEEQQHYFNTPFQLSVPPTVLQGSVLNDRSVWLYPLTVLYHLHYSLFPVIAAHRWQTVHPSVCKTGTWYSWALMAFLIISVMIWFCTMYQNSKWVLFGIIFSWYSDTPMIRGN